MKEKLTVVKLGGNCMDDQHLLQMFLQKFAELPGRKLLVHGGGKIATELGHRLNIPLQMIDGRRVTDSDTLGVVTMVYAGLLNKKLVALLHALHCNAFGFCGADGNFIRAVKRNSIPVDYGFVGDPSDVDCDLLNALLQSALVPVISPVTHDGNGQLLNTNADTVASVIASAMSEHYEVHLLFAFDKTGVLSDPANDASVIRTLTEAQLSRLKEDGKIHSGMIPKLKAGFSALNSGASVVTIQHVSSLNTNQPVTKLHL